MINHIIASICFMNSNGKSQITQEDLDQQLRNSVYEMIFGIKKYEPTTSYSLPMLVSEKMISGKENLIQKAVFLIKKGQNTNSVSIVSMGFDGKCFQKLRYSKLVGSDENFEQYFDYPRHNAKVFRAIMGFVGFTIIFHEELMNSGYFN